MTAPRLVDIAWTQLTTLVKRLVGRLLRTARLTEKDPRDVIFIALDIVGSGRHGSDEQAALRRRLYRAVTRIRHEMRWLIPYDVLDRGDGVLVLLPGGTDTLRVLGTAMPSLAREVRSGNREHGSTKMLLRCALHKGRARRDRWGWVGEDVNLVFRLLDSRTLKRQLGDDPAPVTVAISEAFYRDACERRADEQQLHNDIKALWDDALTRHAFRAKELEQTAWVASVKSRPPRPGSLRPGSLTARRAG